MLIRPSSAAFPRPRARASAHDTVLAAAVVAALAATAPAQKQFEELQKRHLPAGFEGAVAVAWGDVDGDGDQDLVQGGDGQNRLLLNDGTGVFRDATATRLPSVSDSTRDVALVDVDRDGDLDLVVGNGAPLGNTQNRLLLNDGRGFFVDATATHLPIASDFTLAVSVGDVNGDGAPDFVAGNSGQQSRLYVNDGAGRFTDQTQARMPLQTYATRDVELADVDGDGDLDLLMGHIRQDRLYLNDGSGTFTDETSTRLPADDARSDWLLVGDLDADGDNDLLRGDGYRVQLLDNDGSGRFTNQSSARLPGGGGGDFAGAGDFDGDGDVDLVVGARLLRNDGSGAFAAAPGGFVPASAQGQTMDVADADGDGDLDFTVANRVFLNDGRGQFVDATAGWMPRTFDSTNEVVFGDVDGDGDLDLFRGTYFGGCVVHRNDGSGRLDRGAFIGPGSSSRSIAVADVDGDGDLDVFLATGNDPWGQNPGVQNQLFLNDGGGSFHEATSTHLPQVRDITTSALFRDVDGDGDQDLVTGGHGFCLLFLNDGAGVFTESPASNLGAIIQGVSDLAMADVDGDGDDDLVLGLAWENQLWLNDGSGVFQDVTGTHMPVATESTLSLAFADVDGDGDQDLAFGNGGFRREEQNRLCLNDGTGTFRDVTSTHLPAVSDRTNSVVWGDVDGDGDPDLVVGNHYGPSTRLYLNDGTGVLSEATTTRMAVLTDAGTQAIALGDVDDDGDLDLAVGNQGSTDRLLVNHVRQFSAPLLARVGHPYDLKIDVRFAAPVSVDAALPFLSTGTATIPLPPYGNLRLDPLRMVPLPLVQVSPAAGGGVTSIDIPNVPGLVGVPLFAQAVLLRQGAPVRLTSRTGDVILR
jgi:hypothetical protein